MTKTFVKTKEDFVCGHCGEAVVGDGYTNHCPRCLWSRHVDINPGDRQEPCGGLMPPVGYIFTAGRCVLLHRCQVCGAARRNRTAKDDDLARLVNLC